MVNTYLHGVLWPQKNYAKKLFLRAASAENNAGEMKYFFFKGQGAEFII